MSPTPADQHALSATDAPPSTMEAIVQRRYGSPIEVLELARLATPAVGDDDVLVAVRATSVNTPDVVAVTGQPRVLRLKLGLRRPSNPVRGSDVAGVVAAVGRNVTDLRPGDEVFGSLWDNAPVQPGGTFAEYAVVPAAQLVAKPAGIGFDEAAASVMAGLTALAAIRDAGGTSPGSRVLVNGASGGVGTMAVQIAKALGAHVTGVCSTRNLDLVRSLGADAVIDYTTNDFTQGDDRYDVILDNVMNHAPATTLRLLADAGTFIPNSVGTSGGLLGGLPRVARAQRLARRNPTTVKLVTCDVTRENLAALSNLLASGHLHPVIDERHSLHDAPQAVEHVATHHARGKVVVTP